MRSQLPRCAPNAVAFFIASVLLASCSSAGNVTPSQAVPTQGSGLAPNGTPVLGNSLEILASTSASSGGSGCTVTVTASGNAQGPYRGTFTSFGRFNACYAPATVLPAAYSGNFTISSGSYMIAGSFSGTGKGGCNAQSCGDGGKLTYDAVREPGGKAFSGSGTGGMYEGFGQGWTMALVLKSMI